MKNDNYITVLGWMRNELDLKGNHLIIYALIYGFSQDDATLFSGSLTYIVNSTGASRSTTQRVLNELTEYGFLIKSIVDKNGVRFNEYRCSDKREPFVIASLSGVVKMNTPVSKQHGGGVQNDTGGVQNDTGGVFKMTPNILLDNTSDNTSNIKQDISKTSFSKGFEFEEEKNDNPGTTLVLNTEGEKQKKVAPKKSDGLTKIVIAVYWDWFKETHDGTTPLLTAGDTKAAKTLASYLKSIAQPPGVHFDTDAQKVSETLGAILKNWHKINDFLQSQKKLSQISSNITNIISQIKNGKKSNNSDTVAGRQSRDTVANAFKNAGEIARTIEFN